MNSPTKWNIILVGEAGVGKTSMMFRFVKNKFNEHYVATVAIDFLNKDIKVEGDDIKVQIWDSAGQEIYKSIVPQYFRIARGCILVYDVTKITTFHKLTGWLSEFRIYNEKAPVIIVGNKCEDQKAKAVAKSVIKSFAEQEGMDYIECSAKTGENVDQAFDLLFKKVWDDIHGSTKVVEKKSDENENENSNTMEEVPISYKPSEEESFVISELPPDTEMKPIKKKKKCC